jgi:hypothetical protein
VAYSSAFTATRSRTNGATPALARDLRQAAEIVLMAAAGRRDAAHAAAQGEPAGGGAATTKH